MPTNTKEYMLNYYHTNKDKFQPKTKAYCAACDATMHRRHLAKHLRTKKHQDNVCKLAPAPERCKAELDQLTSQMATISLKIKGLKAKLKSGDFGAAPQVITIVPSEPSTSLSPLEGA